jgi:hypothetical protein
MEHLKNIASEAYNESKTANLGTPIYGKILWLRNCIAKRAADGKPIAADYLANCSTMKQITLGIVRNEKTKGVSLNKFERQEIGEELARIILGNM